MIRLEDLTETELGGLKHACGCAIERVLASLGVERPLFAIVLFNDPKTGQYLANCRYEVVIAAMRETANRIESELDIPK